MIELYTDGACSGNPGLAGAGVVLKYGEHVKTISMGLGRATNNIAELTAIKIGLEALTRKDIPIKVYTDSQYAVGVLSMGWNVNKNVELVDEIKVLIDIFKDVTFEKVKGHSGHEWNEQADQLAVAGTGLLKGKTKQHRYTKK